jgi:hypothetical protein
MESIARDQAVAKEERRRVEAELAVSRARQGEWSEAMKAMIRQSEAAEANISIRLIEGPPLQYLRCE